LAEEKTQEKKEQLTIDNFFNQLLERATKTIQVFVAFIFLLIAIGAFYGYIVVIRFPEMALLLLMLPAVIGLLAYYNKEIALVLFILVIIGIILL